MSKSPQAMCSLRELSIAAISALFFIAAEHRVDAATLRVLHTFCQKLNCGDGDQPEGSLVEDGSGDLYGVTTGGGAHGAGVVFGIFPRPGTIHRHQYRVLYDFCAIANCVDGSSPNAPLIVGSDGSLYGTTNAGDSANGNGVIFRLSPVTGRKEWKYSVLYNFCAAKSSCGDGSNPSGGLTYAAASDGVSYDGASPLYGFTQAGGRHFGGVAYSFTPEKSLPRREHVLYAFCAQGGTQCTDGFRPYLTPLLDAGGSLYGVTDNDGFPAAFLVKLSLGTTSKWNEAVLYKFCSVSNCADGLSPSSLAMDLSGNIFGTTSTGGTSSQCGTAQGCGVLFEVTPDETETVLHDFCFDNTCDDGRQPDGIALAPSGNIYGVTVGGGARNLGVLFELGDSFQAIHHFCGLACQDGASPTGLIIDSAGKLFGNTAGGTGTTYRFRPGR